MSCYDGGNGIKPVYDYSGTQNITARHSLRGLDRDRCCWNGSYRHHILPRTGDFLAAFLYFYSDYSYNRTENHNITTYIVKT